jgi:hypothetical protein
MSNVLGLGIAHYFKSAGSYLMFMLLDHHQWPPWLAVQKTTGVLQFSP